MGFVVVGQRTVNHKLNSGKKRPFVLLTMEHHGHPKALFAAEVCGQKVALFPSPVPAKFRLLASMWPRPWPWLPWVAISSYDAKTGCHLLEDGRKVDLTASYAEGALHFQLPLHEVMLKKSKVNAGPENLREMQQRAAAWARAMTVDTVGPRYYAQG
mmetsp:Transcript_120223/g.268362  ORF Transcript_120223/g.268362 Transcript_120223/m.268362 type:complete len:157 (+) Transcript_120223:1-471(+)